MLISLRTVAVDRRSQDSIFEPIFFSSLYPGDCMKMFVSIVAVVMMAFAASTTVSAQEAAPSQVWGVGINGGQYLGAYAYYAVSSTIHVGSGVGLSIQEGQNVFYLAPYAKFLFPSSGNIYPFLFGQLHLMFGDASNTMLNIGGGMQAWVAPRVAVWGAVGVLNLGFDPSYTIFGLLSPAVGVEYNL